MSSSLPDELFFDLVKATEIPDAHAVEVLGFPADEAGSLEGFARRQTQAPDLFLGAYTPSQSKERALIAYICSTRSNLPTYTHECLTRHDPDGSSVCIHSVCVAPEHRRKGVALALLNEYALRLLDAEKGCARLLLIAHEELRPLYEKASFEWLGESTVVHGTRKWYEMRRTLKASSSQAEADVPSTAPLSISSQTLLDLLRAPRTRPSARLLSSFASIDDVINTEAEDKANKYDLICSQEGCGCVILKGGVASLVDKESITLEPTDRRTPNLPPIPEPPQHIQCWLVRPNPMAFENVGFSRPVSQQTTGNGARLKLLVCADCEIGPLGWCTEGGSDFWLIANRVGYRVPT